MKTDASETLDASCPWAKLVVMSLGVWWLVQISWGARHGSSHLPACLNSAGHRFCLMPYACLCPADQRICCVVLQLAQPLPPHRLCTGPPLNHQLLPFAALISDSPQKNAACMQGP